MALKLILSIVFIARDPLRFREGRKLARSHSHARLRLGPSQRISRSALAFNQVINFSYLHPPKNPGHCPLLPAGELC